MAAKKQKLEPPFEFESEIVRVIDGDTIVVKIDIGFFLGFTTHLRLWGINTPETTTKEGKAVRDYVKKLLPPGTKVMIKTFKTNEDEAYRRYLAKIWLPDGTLLNDKLVQEGKAVVYFP